MEFLLIFVQADSYTAEISLNHFIRLLDSIFDIDIATGKLVVSSC